MGWFPDPENRSTADLVIMLVAVVICAILLLTLVGIIAIELVHPEFDSDPLVRVESEILGVLVGALVGFVGGRGVGRAEAHQSE